MTNPFEQIALQQMNGAQRAKERRDVRTAARREEKLRVPTPLEKKQIEKNILAKLYRIWRRNIRDEIVERHGSEVAVLLRLLRNMSWSNAYRVVEYVRAAEWLRSTDAETRLHTLDMIESAFVRARIRDGRPPFDDALWDEPLTPFLEIRREMMGI